MRFLKWHFSTWHPWAIHGASVAINIALYYSGDVIFWYFLAFSFLINGIVVYGNYRYFKNNKL